MNNNELVLAAVLAALDGLADPEHKAALVAAHEQWVNDNEPFTTEPFADWESTKA